MGGRRCGLAGLFGALNRAIKRWQSGVLNGTDLFLAGHVGGGDLEHHAHQIVYGNGRPVRLVYEREEFVPELDDGLVLFLPRVKELLSAEMYWVYFQEVTIENVYTGEEALDGRVDGRSSS